MGTLYQTQRSAHACLNKRLSSAYRLKVVEGFLQKIAGVHDAAVAGKLYGESPGRNESIECECRRSGGSGGSSKDARTLIVKCVAPGLSTVLGWRCLERPPPKIQTGGEFEKQFESELIHAN